MLHSFPQPSHAGGIFRWREKGWAKCIQIYKLSVVCRSHCTSIYFQRKQNLHQNVNVTWWSIWIDQSTGRSIDWLIDWHNLSWKWKTKDNSVVTYILVCSGQSRKCKVARTWNIEIPSYNIVNAYLNFITYLKSLWIMLNIDDLPLNC